jgi:hypothetical protein
MKVLASGMMACLIFVLNHVLIIIGIFFLADFVASTMGSAWESLMREKEEKKERRWNTQHLKHYSNENISEQHFSSII